MIWKKQNKTKKKTTQTAFFHHSDWLYKKIQTNKQKQRKHLKKQQHNFKGIGNVLGRTDQCLQSHYCTYWSADGRMKLIFFFFFFFWGRQCRHISFSRCKAVLSRVSGANLVRLDRLWSPASDGSTHPSCFLSHRCATVIAVIHRHRCDTATQWWIEDNMERSVCSPQVLFPCSWSVYSISRCCMGPTWTISLNGRAKSRFLYNL